MRPVEIALHTVSLGAALLLTAGFWSLRTQASPQVPAVPPTRIEARPDPRVAELGREVESLRLRLAELEAARPVPASSVAPAAEAGDAVMAALDRPEVQEKLKRLAGPSTHYQWADHRSLWGRGGVEEMMKGLNEAQRDGTGKAIAESRERIGDVARRVHGKELTKEQGKDEIARIRAETDARVMALLSAEQYAAYQEHIAPMRKMADMHLFEEGVRAVFRTTDPDGNAVVIETPEPGR